MWRFDEVLREMEKLYRSSNTAEEFLQNIMILWEKVGFLRGEWSCAIEDREAV